MSLVDEGNDYPLLSGNIGSSDGVKLDRKDYRKATNEFMVPTSSSKLTKLSRDSYAVGSLARFNMNRLKLHPKARETAAKIGLKPPVINPFLNTAAQLVECIHCLEDSIEIIEKFRLNGINYNEQIIVGLNENKAVPVKAGNGVGAVEVPRGILYHNYEIDGRGTIINANCIIPTGQNMINILHDTEKTRT